MSCTLLLHRTASPDPAKQNSARMQCLKDDQTYVRPSNYYGRPMAGQAIIFLPCGLFFYAHRMRTLGDDRLIHQEAKWKCETCKAEFDSERCRLRGHTSGKWCRKWKDMTEAQKMKLRQTRKTSQARRGQLYRYRAR